jgi:diaminohydroxyphosphoribosylaminopyrimidine deaminase/5-amino-6-(5-phosphoribosylamino)uracil reductase
LLQRLGQRDITSVLVEGGGELLRSCFERKLVDRVLAFVAPIIVGGREAPGPMGGTGVDRITDALRLHDVHVERIGDDTLISGYAGT